MPQDPSNWQQPPPPSPSQPPYDQHPYGQPQYPAAGYGGYGMSRDHPDGTTVLILGILSLVVCGVLGPFAWAKGNSAIRQIDASPGMYTNRGSVQAGRICGIIATAMMAFGILLVIGAMVLGAASSSTSGY